MGLFRVYDFNICSFQTYLSHGFVNFLFATKEGRYIYRLEEALRRMYSDPKAFGNCHTCGSEVGFERLDALPHARYCIDCKRKEEDVA